MNDDDPMRGAVGIWNGFCLSLCGWVGVIIIARALGRVWL